MVSRPGRVLADLVHRLSPLDQRERKHQHVDPPPEIDSHNLSPRPLPIGDGFTHQAHPGDGLRETEPVDIPSSVIDPVRQRLLRRGVVAGRVHAALPGEHPAQNHLAQHRIRPLACCTGIGFIQRQRHRLGRGGRPDGILPELSGQEDEDHLVGHRGPYPGRNNHDRVIGA